MECCCWFVWELENFIVGIESSLIVGDGVFVV